MQKKTVHQTIILSRDFGDVFFPDLPAGRVAGLISALYPAAELTGLDRQFFAYLNQLRGKGPVIVSACPRVHHHVGRRFPDQLDRFSTNLAPATMALNQLVQEKYPVASVNGGHPAVFEVIFVSPCRAKALTLKQHVRLHLQPEFPRLLFRILPAQFLAFRLRALLLWQRPVRPSKGQQEKTTLPADVLACHGRRAISRILQGETTIPPEKTIVLPYWCAGGCSGRPAILDKSPTM